MPFGNFLRRFIDRIGEAILDFGTAATETTDEILLSPRQVRRRRRQQRRQVRRARAERERERKGKRPSRRERRAARKAPPPPPPRPTPTRAGEPYILLYLDRDGTIPSNESMIRYDYERVAYASEDIGHSTCESLLDAGVPASIMAYAFWLDRRTLPYVVYVGESQ